MHETDGIFPRPDLFTNGDFDAWAEQFRFLYYVLNMTPKQIAQIDYGIDPEHQAANLVFSWAHEIQKTYPRMNVAEEMARISKSGPKRT
ncbi:hypothetical protein FPY71_13340 [Aureimonas fodinaquatilis]|uniref:Uncharacterized protein n=1 Tax=Aureimonas fodinaquatilis TaxID=2565783 RepID=A0A5B0DSS2_9HYPH|nr:hypothetical protein [Aureimonas fodinaquatilis]KAA0969516.1 hypothetical protein FPY71_13340 [Aureimonas fodinaquatilis]